MKEQEFYASAFYILFTVAILLAIKKWLKESDSDQNLNAHKIYRSEYNRYFRSYYAQRVMYNQYGQPSYIYYSYQGNQSY